MIMIMIFLFLSFRNTSNKLPRLLVHKSLTTTMKANSLCLTYPLSDQEKCFDLCDGSDLAGGVVAAVVYILVSGVLS